uniref:DNA polymerase alpha subunit B N-terminal domain-containing protein n=1 Tax=Timema monikensis TaxID=170555 RepID=A0A7R9DXC8_9NEOP|nr:unnamed protein product [Timema monikensis]
MVGDHMPQKAKWDHEVCGTKLTIPWFSAAKGTRVEICETNCIDEEEFVETWMAYTVSNLGGADPTVETLTQMERNCLTKTEQEINTSSKKQKKTSSLVIYNASTIDSFLEYPLV